MWALVPFKGAEGAKGRLSPALSEQERRDLSLAMVRDVLCALAEAPLEGVVIVSRSPVARELAREFATEVFEETVKGLTGAVTEASEHIARRGGSATMIVHGDVPLLNRGGGRVRTRRTSGHHPGPGPTRHRHELHRGHTAERHDLPVRRHELRAAPGPRQGRGHRAAHRPGSRALASTSTRWRACARSRTWKATPARPATCRRAVWHRGCANRIMTSFWFPRGHPCLPTTC